MSWQRTPPDFWRWVPLHTRNSDDEVLWWAIWQSGGKPVKVRVYHRGWTDHGVIIDGTNWLCRPEQFAWWWHEPILPPDPPPANTPAVSGT